MIRFGKQWGETFPLLQTPMIEVHRITAKAGSSCSMHKHEFKFNAFYVISGTLSIEVEKNDYSMTDVTILEAGGFTTVRPNEFHRFVATTDVAALEIYYLGALAEDIVRLPPRTSPVDDWPGSDEMSRRLNAMLPPQPGS